jgi:hypothetical protein
MPYQNAQDQRPGAAGSPQPAAPGYSIDDFQTWAQGRYGRQATPQELQQIGGQVGQPGANGQYTQQQWGQATNYADTLAKQQGWQGGGNTQPVQPTQTQSTPIQTSPLQSQLSSLVSQRLSATPGNVTDDPIYQQQVGAFDVASQREQQRQRAQLAERSAQSGTGASGGFNAQLNSLAERGGEQRTGFAADLAGQRLQQQEQQLQQAMAMAVAIGDQDLQRQIAEQQRQVEQARLGLQQQGLNLQGELGRGDLDLRRYLGRGQLGLGMLSTMLGNEQANNRLGFDYTQLQALMNRNAIMDLLGGNY